MNRDPGRTNGFLRLLLLGWTPYVHFVSRFGKAIRDDLRVIGHATEMRRKFTGEDLPTGAHCGRELLPVLSSDRYHDVSNFL
jgi:hypothetical protein